MNRLAFLGWIFCIAPANLAQAAEGNIHLHCVLNQNGKFLGEVFFDVNARGVRYWTNHTSPYSMFPVVAARG
jgi:hypothetical protein